MKTEPCYIPDGRRLPSKGALLWQTITLMASYDSATTGASQLLLVTAAANLPLYRI